MTFEMVKDSGKRNILVGIGFDSHTKELLDWALVKVADPGDRVVAIHVCRNSDSNAKDKYSLDSYLDDYDGICTKKQVNLKALVLKGNSIRKVLVREAKNHGAVALIVGTSMHIALGGWTSIARYCARQLPTSVEVMSIHNGRVVFRRGSNCQCPGAARDPRPSFYREGSSLGSISLRVPILDTPGWPLLRTETGLAKPTVTFRKMSVVRWVMNLPNRSLPDSPRSNYSPKRENTSEQENCSFADKSETDGTKLVSDLKVLIDANSTGFKWFSYASLRESTSQFSSENLIGKGGCNQVYKGLLPDGKRIAVKILNPSKEAWRNFKQEIEIVTAVKHKCIVPLLGLCIEDNVLTSVYKLQSRGNLEENLNGKGKRESLLSWEVRFRIAAGIAEALNYLHNEHPRPIIHRDVKSSNILLGDQFEPVLSDFGLAIWGPTTTSFVTHSDVLGTFGYLAPEYFMYGKVSKKIDVYSFGVVLLELLSGRRAIGQESLVMWAKPKLESGDLKGILDEDLNVNGDEAEVHRMASAATLCLTQSARSRPNIGQVNEQCREFSFVLFFLGEYLFLHQILKMIRGEEIIKEEIQLQVENLDDNDDEVYPESSAESHLSVALLDMSDCSSFSSVEQSSTLSVEEYLKKRWSRSSSSLD